MESFGKPDFRDIDYPSLKNTDTGGNMMKKLALFVFALIILNILTKI